MVEMLTFSFDLDSDTEGCDEAEGVYSLGFDTDRARAGAACASKTALSDGDARTTDPPALTPFALVTIFPEDEEGDEGDAEDAEVGDAGGVVKMVLSFGFSLSFEKFTGNVPNRRRKEAIFCIKNCCCCWLLLLLFAPSAFYASEVLSRF